MKKLLRSSVVCAAIVAAAALAPGLHVQAGSVANGRPEDVGLSSERLQRITQLNQHYVDAKQLSGVVSVVGRRGRIAYFEAQGAMDLDAHAAMRRDAIFRIASMSKPVTGVAIMMLMEEGKLRLTDPVSRFIPEFKEMKVAVPKESKAPAAAAQGQAASAPEFYTVPAAREITIRDLLTHTSGLESGSLGNRIGARVAPRDVTKTVADWVSHLPAVPLDFQPGSQWTYSPLAGMDTLGRIVEIASGQPYDQFLKQRLFDPLGMKDTSFAPPADRKPRVMTLYGRTPHGLERQDTPAWLATSTFFSGGGGLWSTAEDYAQFALMLASGGELNGKRFLSPRTIDLMGSNHVGDLYTGAGAGTRAQGMGFGLSVEVVLDPVKANRRTSAGSFGWDGAFGTHFWVDRKEQLIGVLMVQTPGTGITRDFENAVMQAIID
jgi:CubicO group peptidase (beta-lactamase class C family)